ncbi:DUF695 domain-containing protein (plasmid) [Methylomonas sp. HW2-6]|uniref:DUF695 domain-containing protein n=1 Tax=Methylomonas sp. HW2-6 TaxID=3376687 RepID=UPI004041073E
MFGLFKKVHDSSMMFADDNWQVAQGEYDGSPIVVRINANLRSFVGNSELVLKIGIAIPLNNPRHGEMPDPEENKTVSIIEDKVLEMLKSKGSAVQALAITTGTFKEFVYCTKPEIDVASFHQELKNGIPSHNVQCIATIEKNWETYMQWANG